MKKNVRNILIIAFVIVGLYTSTSVIAGVGPSVVINPEKPVPQSTITFTATIPSEGSLDKVVILVQECEKGLCFSDGYNESMNKVGDDTYEAQVTLKHKTAVEIHYRLGYLSGGVWTWYPASSENMTSVDLATGQSNNNSNNSGDNTNGTPGFEFISLIISISLILLIIGKRKK